MIFIFKYNFLTNKKKKVKYQNKLNNIYKYNQLLYTYFIYKK